MRAIAILAVILYHVHFPGISGGFVGVDVFFVLSGFLITRLVLGELATSGTISLANFWGRRARRLLPAAATVVVVTVLIAKRVLPPLTQRDLAADVVGAGTFTANFVFAQREGDYFAVAARSVAAAALLVAGRRGAVLPGVAAAARAPRSASAPVPAAAAGDDQCRGVDEHPGCGLALVEQAELGVLPPAVPDG